MDYTPAALHKRLCALSCPPSLLPSPLSAPSSLSSQILISWLEDTHIRRLPVHDRLPLRRVRFHSALRTYLRILHAPNTSLTPEKALLYLVDLSLAITFAADASRYNRPVDPWAGRCVPVTPGSARDPQVAVAVAPIAATLQLPPGTPTEQLLAAAALLEHRPPATACADLADLPLGFSSGDVEVDQIATVLRILCLRRLRHVQDQVNCMLTDMQGITADPRTDSKLGKVGR